MRKFHAAYTVMLEKCNPADFEPPTLFNKTLDLRYAFSKAWINNPYKNE